MPTASDGKHNSSKEQNSHGCMAVQFEGICNLRITGGNFRLFNRLLSQIQRVLEINGLRTISKEAVEAAREGLIISSS